MSGGELLLEVRDLWLQFPVSSVVPQAPRPIARTNTPPSHRPKRWLPLLKRAAMSAAHLNTSLWLVANGYASVADRGGKVECEEQFCGIGPVRLILRTEHIIDPRLADRD